LDLGCGTGIWALSLCKAIGSKNMYGIEIEDQQIREAKARGLNVVKSDLNKRLPFKDDFFDVVHTCGVIEHLINIDIFIEEIYRVVKPEGYAIISTENLSSIDNLLALVLGWQAFSQNISQKRHLGNIFSPLYGQPFPHPHQAHKIVFTYFGLQQMLKEYHFHIDKVLTAGYGFLVRVDPIHARFIAIRVRKR
jgi:ubiquinone/menaquinone biosynthesis C-methylase UbiE